MGAPKNSWFLREDPIKMDDLGVPPFMETHMETTICEIEYAVCQHAVCQYARWQH